MATSWVEPIFQDPRVADEHEFLSEQLSQNVRVKCDIFADQMSKYILSAK